MLVRQGIVSRADGARILRALRDVDASTLEKMLEVYEVRFPKTPVQFEHYLTVQVGDIASNINIGRTLPPPYYRMKMREDTLALIDAVLEFRETLLASSEAHADVVMPGYTHYHHAQVMTFGHYLLGFHDAIAHACGQLEAVYASVNRCDLGCGALAGTSFDVDRDLPAALLGFDGILEHTNYCVAGTDQAVDLANAMNNLALPISRTATELEHWSTFEYNMLELSTRLSEPSSMMPQKKNACLFEDIRQIAGVVLGAYIDVSTRSHNIMWGDTIEVIRLSDVMRPVVGKMIEAIRIFNKAVPELSPHREVMLRLAREGYSTATELANILVRERRIPWRICHAIVAEVVRTLYDQGRTAAEITPPIVDAAARKIIGEPVDLTPEQLESALDPVKFVEAHKCRGGVAPAETRRMVRQRNQVVAAERRRQAERKQRLEEADRQLCAAADAIISAA
ncbi:hypothetical protein HS125_15350 [bacterium]|nr:hypothetical protein [bacterium]